MASAGVDPREVRGRETSCVAGVDLLPVPERPCRRERKPVSSLLLTPRAFALLVGAPGLMGACDPSSEAGDNHAPYLPEGSISPGADEPVVALRTSGRLRPVGPATGSEGLR